MKRIMAIMLTLLMIVALVGCGHKKRQPIQLTLSTEDAEAILKAAGISLPDAESAEGAGTKVQWFGWSDPFQNYNETEIVNTGFWTFTEKYGNTFEFVEAGDYFSANDDLANLIMAGTPPDCMTGGTNSTASFPMKAIKGTSQAVDQWIDYDDPLWAPMKGVAEKYLLGGKHYQICMQTKPSNVCVYNRRVTEEWGFDDPAELYWNDEWTWDKFFDMCVEFSDPDDDRFALDGYAFTGMFIESTGQQVLQIDANGKYYSNLDSPQIERGQNYLYDLLKNDCCYGRGSWSLRDNATFGAGLKDGKCLFYVIGESFFTAPVEEIEAVWGDITNGEVMFAPLPRDAQGDGVYYMSSSFEDVKGSMIIINGAKNPAGAALLASCIRFKVIDPTVINIDKKQMMNTYKWSEEMLDMSDECQKIAQANFIIDLTGNLPDGLQSVHDRLGNGIIRGGSNPSSWAQLKEANQESFEYYIEELNALIDEYNNA